MNTPVKDDEVELTNWLVTVTVISKYEFDILAASKADAIDSGIDMTEDTPPVDSYVDEVHARQLT